MASELGSKLLFVILC